jgi:cardiolipin synthase
MRAITAVLMAGSVLASACSSPLPLVARPATPPAQAPALVTPAVAVPTAKVAVRPTQPTPQNLQEEVRAAYREQGVTPSAGDLAEAEQFLTTSLASAEALAAETAGPGDPAPTLPNFLVSVPPTVNDTTLLIDDSEIFPDLLQHLRSAQTSIQVDIFLLGGDIGMTIAQALVERAKAGVQVQVMLDPKLGLGGPTVDGIMKVVNYLKANDVVFRFYPLQLFGKMPNYVQNRMQIDHNKIVVVDRSTAFIGGMNFDDLARPNRDLTLRFSGPAAAEVSAMLDAEWSLGKVPDANFGTKSEGLVRLTQTAPQQKTTKEVLISEIAQAQRSIRVTMYEFGDPDMAKALADAFRRGIDVRVILDPKAGGLKKYGAAALPDGLPNVMPARELLAAGAQVKWFVPWRNNQELHMKAMSIDGHKLFAGSTNWTMNAFNRYRETGFVLDGPEVAKYDAMFEDLWQHHGERLVKLTVKQRLTARMVDLLNKQDLAFF